MAPRNKRAHKLLTPRRQNAGNPLQLFALFNPAGKGR